MAVRERMFKKVSFGAVFICSAVLLSGCFPQSNADPVEDSLTDASPVSEAVLTTMTEDSLPDTSPPDTSPPDTSLPDTQKPDSSEEGTPSYGSDGNGSASTDKCAEHVDQNISLAVNEASEGAVICVAAGDYSGEGVISVSRNGVDLKADGSVKVQGVEIVADEVTVDGFQFVSSKADEAAISLEGTSNTVINNLVSESNAQVGIGCAEDVNCTDSKITGNTITGIESIGIQISGNGNLVEGNNVYGLARSSADYDVDALRFFGSGHRILNNYFHDINEFQSVRDSSGDTPHVDCFQTFTNMENGNPVKTTDVLIEGNYCVRVSRQCLILENDKTDEDVVSEITFRNNVCEVYDSQIINLKGVKSVDIHNNYLGGDPTYHVVNFQDAGLNGSKPVSEASVKNNIVQYSNDVSLTTGDNPGGEVEANVETKKNSTIPRSETFQDSPSDNYPAVEPDDFVTFKESSDAEDVENNGVDVPAAPQDLEGNQRVKGDAIDVGPFEK